jgi:hypothetical protein
LPLRSVEHGGPAADEGTIDKVELVVRRIVRVVEATRRKDC